MKYILSINALGPYPEIEISEADYISLKQAKEILANGLAIEEKYEILISNYLEFENELLLQSNQQMIRDVYDYDNFFDIRVKFNTKLVNLLTSTRLYVDQLQRHVSEILPDRNKAKDDIKKLFANEYDKNSEYRFMEALRNYVQHRGIPVHSTTHSAARQDFGEESLLVYSTELFSLKTLLKEI